MTLRFPYLDEPIRGPAPPSMPKTARDRWRPLVPITAYGPSGIFVSYTRALLDSGADDSILPMDAAFALGIPLLPTTAHGMRWRGQVIALRFGPVELELVDAVGATLRWRATVAFSAAAMRYPLLGISGCLEFLDVRLFGTDRALEVEASAAFPVIV